MSIEIYIFKKVQICVDIDLLWGRLLLTKLFCKINVPVRQSNLVQIFETWIIVIIDRVNISNYAINGNILYPFKKEGLFEHERNIIYI